MVEMGLIYPYFLSDHDAVGRVSSRDLFFRHSPAVAATDQGLFRVFSGSL